MPTSIELVDPLDRAVQASAILQAAWKPPCLHYSAAYLRWQLSFPARLSSAAAMAFIDSRPVGYVALMTRQFAFADARFTGYVLSFAAVDPSAAGQGIGKALYGALLKVIPPGVPVLAFAAPRTAGERLLVSSFQRAAFRQFQLAPCRAIGYMETARPIDGREPGGIPSTVTREVSTYREFSEAHRANTAQATVWTDMPESQWAHYREDPRGRKMLAIYDDQNIALGTAMVTMAEVLSTDGIQRVPMLEGLTAIDPSPKVLRSAFTFAAQHAGPRSTIVASNLSHLDLQTLKAAGLRTLPSTFNSYLFVKGDPQAVERAVSLSLEVI